MSSPGRTGDPGLPPGQRQPPAKSRVLVRGWGRGVQPQCPRLMSDTERGGKTPPGTRSQGYGHEPQAQAGCGQMGGEPCTRTPPPGPGLRQRAVCRVLCASRRVSAAWAAELGCRRCLVFRVHAEPAVFTLGVYSKSLAEISAASFHHNLASGFGPGMLLVGSRRLVLALVSPLGLGSRRCSAPCYPRCSRSLPGSGGNPGGKAPGRQTHRLGLGCAAWVTAVAPCALLATWAPCRGVNGNDLMGAAGPLGNSTPAEGGRMP